MNHEDIKIGMKVVPFKKTNFGFGEDCNSFRRIRSKECEFLYVKEYCTELKAWALSTISPNGGGDYYHSSDFFPYHLPNEILVIRDNLGCAWTFDGERLYCVLAESEIEDNGYLCGSWEEAIQILNTEGYLIP